MASNTVVPRTIVQAKLTASYEFDESAPIIVGIELDMEAGTFEIEFDEPVEMSDILPQFITVHNNNLNDYEEHPLSGAADMLTSLDDEVVKFRMEPADVEALKALFKTATRTTDTFLRVEPGFVKDMRAGTGNSIELVEAQPVTAYAPDATDPNVVEFSILDMNGGTLTIHYSEPVDKDTIIYSGITLQSNVGTAGVTSLTLTGGSTEYVEDSLKKAIIIGLEQDDIGAIRLRTAPLSAITLGRSRTNSYLSAAAGHIKDAEGNPVKELGVASAFQVERFDPDETPASLEAFGLDLDAYTLTMTFNDVVAADELFPQGITLQSDQYEASILDGDDENAYTLTGGSTASPDGFTIVVDLTKTDVDAIKYRPLLAYDEGSTFLAMDADTIEDDRGVAVIAIPSREALPVSISQMQPDSVDPVFLGFDLDMDELELHFSFNEPMDVSSLDNTMLHIYSETDFYKLTGGTRLPADRGDKFTLSLTTFDANELKSRAGLADSLANTYIHFSEDAITDMAKNTVTEVTVVSAKQVEKYTPDTTEPRMLDFDLDLTAETLTLTFSEAMDWDSLTMNKLTLMEHPDSQENGLSQPNAAEFTLSMYADLSIEDQVKAVILLNNDDGCC